MGWLRDHQYLAVWLAPVVAFAVPWIQKRKTSTIDSFQLLLYVMLIVSFAVTVSGAFDQTSRLFANFIAVFCLGAILASKRQLFIPVDKSAPRSKNPTRPPD